MTVKIYLRSIEQDKNKCLAMFDSHRDGDINNLTTVVKGGDTILWKLDRCSGIKSITEIYPKLDKPKIFKTGARKRFLCKGFKLQVPENVAEGLKEAYLEEYNIKYILNNGESKKIDPYIRVEPV